MADKINLPRIDDSKDSIQRAMDAIKDKFNKQKSVGVLNEQLLMVDGSAEVDTFARFTDKGLEGVTINDIINLILPAGKIEAYAGTVIPSGYLNCDGSAISRTTYAALFAAIGTTWGAGDGTTTFNLPDLRSATLRGVGTPTLYTSNTVIALADIIDDKFQEHRHKYGGVYNYAFKASTGTAVGVITSSGQTSAGETTGAGYDTYRTGLETTGKARGVYWLIKY